jgi:FkbM family methyltransferase
MKYDYVDIGSCDFDTAYDVAKSGDRVLLVEPIKYYLDRIPDRENQVKANVAISSTTGQIPVYYVPDVSIHLFDLPSWTRGCNSVGQRHPTVDRLLEARGLNLNIVNKNIVEVISFKELCDRYDITEIGKLKIDTEGHEQYILPSVLEMIWEGMRIEEIKFENQEALGNKPFLDELTIEFVKLAKYIVAEVTDMDTTLRLHDVKNK